MAASGFSSKLTMVLPSVAVVVMYGEQQQPDEPDDLLVVEALAVHLGLQQFAGQVLARVGRRLRM